MATACELLSKSGRNPAYGSIGRLLYSVAPPQYWRMIRAAFDDGAKEPFSTQTPLPPPFMLDQRPRALLARAGHSRVDSSLTPPSSMITGCLKYLLISQSPSVRLFESRWSI